ncbi:MarR family winged helix-turn-helix transcriptional regulator [Xylanibacter muris]
MRELYKALSLLENELQTTHGVSLNEAMVMCAIGTDSITASTVTGQTGLSASNASKVIRALERRKLLLRKFGKDDKRLVFLSLTASGKDKLDKLKCHQFDIPPTLLRFFDTGDSAIYQ